MGEGFLLAANLTDDHAKCPSVTLHLATFNGGERGDLMAGLKSKWTN